MASDETAMPAPKCSTTPTAPAPMPERPLAAAMPPEMAPASEETSQATNHAPTIAGGGAGGTTRISAGWR